jgi:hypothetical protein
LRITYQERIHLIRRENVQQFWWINLALEGELIRSSILVHWI